VSEDGGAINRAVVIANERPALWDEVASEHAEARIRSLRNRRLLGLSGMKVWPVAVVRTCSTADVCRASCFP
jgi:hypothetical protein